MSESYTGLQDNDEETSENGADDGATGENLIMNAHTHTRCGIGSGAGQR